MNIVEFQNRILAIVKNYASLDEDKKNYITFADKSPLSEEHLLEIDRALHKLISTYLNQDGKNEEKINAHAKKLRTLFHPDKTPPLINWLEKQLGEDDKREYCIKVMEQIKDKLLANNKDSLFNVFLAPSIVEYKNKLNESTSFTQRLMWRQLIAMLETLQKYDNSNYELAGKTFQDIALLFPLMTVSVCIGLFLPEITTFLAVAFTASKSGEWISLSNVTRSKARDGYLNWFGNALMQVGIGMLAKLTQLNVKAIQSMLTNGNGFYQSLKGGKPQFSPPPDNPMQIIVYGKSSPGKRQFSSPHMADVAEPLVEYQQKQRNQLLSGWRAGKQKNRLFQEALKKMTQIDQSMIDEGQKMAEIGKSLRELTCKYEINSSGKKAMRAINKALFFNQLYNPEPPATIELIEEEQELLDESNGLF